MRATPVATNPGPTSVSASSKVNEEPLELLVIDLMYRHTRLDSEVSAFQDSQGRLFLPLRHLSIDLGFRLQIDPSRRSANGFLCSPSDRFELDGRGGTSKR